jgi:hypothetical protein
MSTDNPYDGIHPEHASWEDMADHRVFLPSAEEHLKVEEQLRKKFREQAKEKTS